MRRSPFSVVAVLSLGEAEDIGDGAEVVGRFDAVAALLSGVVGVVEAGVAVAFP